MTNDGHHDSPRWEEEETAPAAGIEAYEIDAGTVLYDTGNPLAWIESSVAIPLADAA